MAQRPEQSAAKRLLDALSRPMPADEQLDNLVPDYIDAELAGENAAVRFPEVHAYILSNEEAGEMYTTLLDAEMADRAATLANPAAINTTSVSFKPDLSFLNSQTASQTNLLLKEWRQRVVAFAQQLAQTLQPKRMLHFEDFVEHFFDIRSEYPDALSLKSGGSNVFAAVEGDVPDELRWLEATYQFARLRTTNGDPTQLAQTVANNIGLPKSLHKRFVELISTWTA